MSLNTYRKGSRNQLKAKRYYEGHGYEVEVVRYTKWNKIKDFFGLWDLICVGPQDIRFIQVKTNQHPDKEWQERAKVWGPSCSWIVREYVVYKDYSKGDVPSARVIYPCGSGN